MVPAVNWGKKGKRRNLSKLLRQFGQKNGLVKSYDVQVKIYCQETEIGFCILPFKITALIYSTSFCS